MIFRLIHKMSQKKKMLNFPRAQSDEFCLTVLSTNSPKTQDSSFTVISYFLFEQLNLKLWRITPSRKLAVYFCGSLSVRGIRCQAFWCQGSDSANTWWMVSIEPTQWHNCSHPRFFSSLLSSRPELRKGDMLCLSADEFTMTNCRVNFQHSFAPLHSACLSASSSSCPSQWNTSKSPCPFMCFVRTWSNWEG